MDWGERSVSAAALSNISTLSFTILPNKKLQSLLRCSLLLQHLRSDVERSIEYALQQLWHYSRIICERCVRNWIPNPKRRLLNHIHIMILWILSRISFNSISASMFSTSKIERRSLVHEWVSKRVGMASAVPSLPPTNPLLKVNKSVVQGWYLKTLLRMLYSRVIALAFFQKVTLLHKM